jgi:hypothetical protein
MAFSKDTIRAHRARWFVWAWDGQGHSEKLPHTSTMRGLWGWDVECSCGWKTSTGGATRRSVEQDLWFHRWSAEQDAEAPAQP